MTTKETLNKLITEYKGTPVEATESTTFDELDFDSMDKMDLIFAIEEAFGITFGDDLSVATVGELVAKIEELK